MLLIFLQCLSDAVAWFLLRINRNRSALILSAEKRARIRRERVKEIQRLQHDHGQGNSSLGNEDLLLLPDEDLTDIEFDDDLTFNYENTDDMKDSHQSSDVQKDSQNLSNA
jgi:hypothetical protein